MDSNIINILVVPVGDKPYVKQIENQLKSMQDCVKGYIEIVTLEPDVVMVVNEEGKLEGLPINRKVSINKVIDDTIVGDFFVCGADEVGEFTSLSADNISKYRKIFNI